MSGIKKIVLGFALAFATFMTLGSVKAADIDFSTIQGDLLGGTPVEITAADTLTFNGETWIGQNGRIALNSGKATLQYDSTYVNITLDGSAVIKSGKQFIMQLDLGGGTILPVKLTVNNGSALNIDGTLAIPTKSNGTLINNGSVNINGNLEIRNEGVYEGTGVTNLYGNLAVYGSTGANLKANVNMFEGANVYADSDISSKLVIAETNTDEYTWDFTENNKVYTSVTAGLNDNFAYGYTLMQNKVETPVVSEPVDNDKTEAKEEIKNPETADNILVYVALLLGASVVTAGTSMYIKKRFN